MNRERFDALCEQALRESRHAKESGIGTLQEKRMHAVIKKYLCPDEDFHEVGVADTRYVSDVRIGNEIYEVQTGAFYPMKQKIAHYLARTDCSVTVVHPISVVQWMCWVDPKTYEIGPRRKVSRHGRVEDLLAELYCLLPYLGEIESGRLRFRLLLVETQDFRLLDGWSRDRKRGSTLYERIPLSLIDEIEFSKREDFLRFIPDDLPPHFTVREFSVRTKIRGRDAYSAVRVLCALGLFGEGERIGRSMGFLRTDKL